MTLSCRGQCTTEVLNEGSPGSDRVVLKIGDRTSSPLSKDAPTEEVTTGGSGWTDIG